MPLALPPGSRAARVLVTAALLSLTTACGPLDLESEPAAPAVEDAGRLGSPAADRGAQSDAPAAAVVPTDPMTATAPPTVSSAPSTPPTPVASPTPAPVSQASSAGTSTGAATGRPADGTGGGHARSSTADAAASPAGSPAATSSRPAAGGSGPLTNWTASSSAAGYTADYRVFAEGVDRTRPVGLLVYADGTGEYGLENPTSSYAIGGQAGLAAVARGRNMVLLTPFSPNRSCQCWEQGDPTGYADHLAALIAQVKAQYGAGPLWVAGYSSGAQAATRFLFPAHPELWGGGGGVIAIAGGGAPAGRSVSFPTGVVRNVVLRWDTGALDSGAGGGFNALSGPYGAQAGQSWYAARGFGTAIVVPPGVGHDRSGQFGRIVGGLLG